MPWFQSFLSVGCQAGRERNWTTTGQTQVVENCEIALTP
jgi:hypothetical protein